MNFLSLTTNHTGPAIAAALDDKETIPGLPPLKELNNIGFVFPRSVSTTHNKNHPSHVYSSHINKQVCIKASKEDPHLRFEEEKLVKFDGEAAGLATGPSQESGDEASYWISHPASRSYLCHRIPRKLMNTPTLDLSDFPKSQVKIIWIMFVTDRNHWTSEASLQTQKKTWGAPQYCIHPPFRFH